MTKSSSAIAAALSPPRSARPAAELAGVDQVGEDLELDDRRRAVEDLARVSPLASAHVIPSGGYRFPRTSDRRESLE